MFGLICLKEIVEERIGYYKKNWINDYNINVN